MSPYTHYYVTQAQTGSGMPYFTGISNQRGHGLGSFLGGLFRSVLPFLSSSARILGKEALTAGGNVLSDIAQGRQPMESVKRAAAEAGKHMVERLSSSMGGSGIKRTRSQAFLQSPLSTRRRQTRPRKRARHTHNDIF